MKDFCGNADGMVAPIDDERILLNGCWINKAKAFHKRLRKILDAHFKVEEIPAWDSERYSWCYLNYLKVPNGILLPCLSENIDCESDIAAINYFEKVFPGMEIVPIFAKPLIKKGGALHCVTWEYIEKRDY